MEHSRYTTLRKKYHTNDNKYFTELSHGEGNEFLGRHTARKRTDVPPHKLRGHPRLFNSRSGSITPDIPPGFENVCHTCSQSNSRIDAAPTESIYYDFEEEINRRIQSEQSNKENRKILKKVRFQLTPSKSTPSTIKCSMDGTCPLPRRGNRRQSTKEDSVPAPYENEMPLQCESYVSHPVKAGPDLDHNSSHPLQLHFGARRNQSPSQKRKTVETYNVTGVARNHQATHYSSDSDLSSDSDTDADVENNAPKQVHHMGKHVPVGISYNSSHRKRNNQAVHYTKLPSRLPRPVAVTPGIDNNFGNSNKQLDEVSSRVKPAPQRPRYRSDSNTDFLEAQSHPQLLRSSASEDRKINDEGHSRKYATQHNIPPTSASTLKGRTRIIVFSDISEDDEEREGFIRRTYDQELPRGRYVRDSTTLDTHTSRGHRKPERHVYLTNGGESEDEEVDDNKHSVRTDSFRSHSHIRRIIHPTHDIENRGLHSKGSYTAQQDEEYYKQRKGDNVTTTSESTYLCEHSTPSDHTQTGQIQTSFEPIFSETGRFTRLDKSGKLSRRKNRKKSLEEERQGGDVDNDDKLHKDRSKNDYFSQYEILGLTNYDIQLLRQAEETHRMFMAVWLPPRASSRTFSKSKRSVLDTPAHLLMLRELQFQEGG